MINPGRFIYVSRYDFYFKKTKKTDFGKDSVIILLTDCTQYWCLIFSISRVDRVTWSLQITGRLPVGRTITVFTPVSQVDKGLDGMRSEDWWRFLNKGVVSDRYV